METYNESIVTEEKLKNIVAKGEISPFVTMFSTEFNNCYLIYRETTYFGPIVFKDVCCRFVVTGKGFKSVKDLQIIPFAYLNVLFKALHISYIRDIVKPEKQNHCIKNMC